MNQHPVESSQIFPIFGLPNSVFRHLPSIKIDEIISISEQVTYQRNKLIYRQGHNISGSYFVLRGIIKIFKTGEDGKEQIIRFARPGDIIAFRSLFSNEPACTSAQVHADSTLLFIPGFFLIHLVKTDGTFALDLIQLICQELGEANEYITDIAQKTVRERLAEVLLHIEKTFGTDSQGFINLSLTREEMANIVGTATESTIRLLSEFKDDKLIDLSGRKIKILNRPFLQKLANMS